MMPMGRPVSLSTAPNGVQRGLMGVVLTMAEVQPKDVRASIEKGANHLWIAARGTERRDDLCRTEASHAATVRCEKITGQP